MSLNKKKGESLQGCVIRYYSSDHDQDEVELVMLNIVSLLTLYKRVYGRPLKQCMHSFSLISLGGF